MIILVSLIDYSDGGQEFTLLFKDPKVRSAWEQDLLSSKLNLETANWNKLPPQFLDRIPVDRTRAGMQVRYREVKSD